MLDKSFTKAFRGTVKCLLCFESMVLKDSQYLDFDLTFDTADGIKVLEYYWIVSQPS